jgi:protein-L-isoaspartate(D-aspartate) O-methyltransferase
VTRSSSRPAWIEHQLVRRGIGDERVLDAMERVPREAFVPVGLREQAYDDRALPLGHGQTISQPYIVALTCEALELFGDERVLDVGTGSGYAAAVLSELAAEVHTVERIRELAETAGEALTAAGYGTVRVHQGDGADGLAAFAPYDAIAVAAATPDVPSALWAQLREGGRLVLPLRTGKRSQQLCALERTPAGPRLLASVPASFVPLIRNER